MTRQPIGLHGYTHASTGSDPIPGGGGGGGGSAGPTIMSTPGTLSVVNGTMRWYPTVNGTLSAIYVAVGTAPTGASLIVAIRKNGSTTIGTATIAVSTFTTTVTPSPATFSGPNTDYYTYNITQIGSTVAGTDLAVQFVWAAS